MSATDIVALSIGALSVAVLAGLVAGGRLYVTFSLFAEDTFFGIEIDEELGLVCIGLFIVTVCYGR